MVRLSPRLLVNWSPLSPIASLYPPPPNSQPFLDFPEPNMYLIRAHHKPSSQYTRQLLYVHDWYHSYVSSILTYTNMSYNVQLCMAHSPYFISPCWSSLALPFVLFYLLGTLLAVTGSVHLSPRLLVNWLSLTQPSPFQIPRVPITPRLTKTTSGMTRHLLSGTVRCLLTWLINVVVGIETQYVAEKKCL